VHIAQAILISRLEHHIHTLKDVHHVPPGSEETDKGLPFRQIVSLHVRWCLRRIKRRRPQFFAGASDRLRPPSDRLAPA
jgi:hypothetical protein